MTTRTDRAPSDRSTLAETEPGLPFRTRPQQWDRKGADISELIRPMLEALAKLTDLESTYLTVFDWERREQEVRFAFNAGPTRVKEGHRIPLPPGLAEEAFPGVTRSPGPIGRSQPDSLVARGLGFKAFVSVPVTVARHRLFGMLCGASKEPQTLSETAIGMFESFASIMAGHLVQIQMEAAEDRAAAAELQLLTRARFLAEAEHRLKTRLTVLQGTSLTLRDRRGDLTEPARIELENSMVRNVVFLSKELESLLVEARAEVRSHELSRIDTDVGALVREIAEAFDGLGAAHDVVADVVNPVRASVDPAALYQVLEHVIDNAIKYSPNGGRITIRAFDAAGSVAVEVIDEGVGLPSAIDIFEAFRRGDPHDQGTPGIGLGLHIVRNLVEAMEGTVTARENRTTGSTFTITLPATAGGERHSEPVDHADAIITLAYYDADGRLVDSEQLHVSPDAGSLWIKPSEKILSWPAVRTVRAFLAREPATPVDIDVHLLPPACTHRITDGSAVQTERF